MDNRHFGYKQKNTAIATGDFKKSPLVIYHLKKLGSQVRLTKVI
jgi:hypothetical protein